MSAQSNNDNVELPPEETLQAKFTPLRVWPPILLLVGMLISGVPFLIRSDIQALQAVKMMGPALCGLLVVGWWLTASRARWQERLIGLLGIFATGLISFALLDDSMRGVPTILLTIPMGTAAFAFGAVLCNHVLSYRRVSFALLLAALGFGFSILLRGGGIWADTGDLSWEWRFSAPTEHQLATRQSTSPPQGFSTESARSALAAPEWPAFRGADRSGWIPDVVVDLAKNAPAPQKLWEIPVGLGWSSFSVAGPCLFTQEQRGTQETVVCYSSQTGEQVWATGIEARFEDSIGGSGPRATPTIADGDLFVLGAGGQLMRIRATTGEILWTTNLCEVAQRQPPTWGFSSSPLVVDSAVIVHAGGTGDRGTCAFDIHSGELLWSVPAGDHSYSSPHLCELGGMSFVVMLTNHGLDLIDPTTGQRTLAFECPEPGYRCLQPTVVGTDSLIIPGASEMYRVEFEFVEGQPRAKKVWNSRALKSDFNDQVFWKHHLFGFDGAIFGCMDARTGRRTWKGGRYGNGQVVLLPASDLLLILSERGEVVFVRADPNRHQEVARFNAIDGKTWNHPVVVGDRLYVRNATQAACFQLPLEEVQTEANP